mgnify:CR=1 FL=1
MDNTKTFLTLLESDSRETYQRSGDLQHIECYITFHPYDLMCLGMRLLQELLRKLKALLVCGYTSNILI